MRLAISMTAGDGFVQPQIEVVMFHVVILSGRNEKHLLIGDHQ
jgi:hypothetical protein